jgi:Lrp/AsnC family leucine-responsive transcriptional regulator
MSSDPVGGFVDQQDVRILAELARDARVPYATVATRLGLSPSAVAARVKRLEGSGVVQGYAAAPQPRLLGMTEGLLVFTHVDDLAERESEILASLPDVPGVRFVDVALDGSVHVWVWHAGGADAERVERAAISLVGKPPSLTLTGDGGPSAVDVAAADWRLLRALVPDARAPLKEVARRARLSFKTAKRRLAQLVRTGALRMEPVLSPSEAEGLVLFTLALVLRPDARLDDVLRVLPDTTIAQRSRPDAPVVLLHVARRSLREAQRDHRAVAACPAVERALFGIATRRRADAWLDDAIAARIAALQEPVATVAPAPVQVAPRRPA